jgi:hypothetical protein
LGTQPVPPPPDPKKVEETINRQWDHRHPSRATRDSRIQAPVYVSLTSYAARFETLSTTLKCLLMQTYPLDGVILWIAESDFELLPPAVTTLEGSGLQIRVCRDLRSFKKIIPALSEQPDAFWVTADDDCYYPSGWLKELVRAWSPDQPHAICHRAHRIRLDPAGAPLPYLQWDLELAAPSTDPLNFMTGVGGVLYPPHCFTDEVLDEALFMRLCPAADDVWLWWMLRRNGYSVKKIGGAWPLISWQGSQKTSLYQANVLENGNDFAMRNMIAHFGFPAARPSAASTAP